MLGNYFSKRKPNVEDIVRYISELGGGRPAIKRFPAKTAVFGSFGELDHRIVNALKRRGVEALYSHQSEAVACALAGEDCVIATPTASGKTLCYNLPVLHAVLHNPSARALYLFPTKALAQDQLAELGELSSFADGKIHGFVYDGDTEPVKRRLARTEGHVVITNPDMLNSGILPHRHKMVRLFSESQIHRRRRAAHLPRHLRLAPCKPLLPPRAHLRILRLAPHVHLLLRDDCEPRRARGGSDWAENEADNGKRRAALRKRAHYI